MTDFASLVASLGKARGRERHALVLSLRLAFERIVRERDIAAARAYLDAFEPLGLTPPLVPGSVEDRRAFIATFGPRIESSSAGMRDWAAHYLFWVGLDGGELAHWAAPLLRASVDAEIPAGARKPVARVACRALGSAIASTKYRDVFMEAAKTVDADLDEAQRKNLRKQLAQIFPGALAALGGKASRPRRPPNEAELLAAIHASLDDDGPRLVYADALLEVGDVRGELIILQCGRAAKRTPPSERERELLRLNGRAWLGPLARAVTDAEYARGFLVGCAWKQSSWSFDEVPLYGHPIWATVTEIRIKRGAFFRNDHALVSDPVMLSLRTLTGIDRVSFLTIERSDLQHVGIVHFEADEKTLAALALHERLRRIDVDRDPVALRAWVLDEHPSVQTITWEGRRYEREGTTWIESAT